MVSVLVTKWFASVNPTPTIVELSVMVVAVAATTGLPPASTNCTVNATALLLERVVMAVNAGIATPDTAVPGTT